MLEWSEELWSAYPALVLILILSSSSSLYTTQSQLEVMLECSEELWFSYLALVPNFIIIIIIPHSVSIRSDVGME